MLEQIVKQSVPLAKDSKMLIFGGGFSGQHIAAVARGLGANVLCSRRSKNTAGADFVFNSLNNEIPPENIFEGTTHLLSCIPPNEKGKDPVLENLQAKLKTLSFKWVGYLSTTGVYGDSQGKWVEENKLPEPKQNRSKKRLACEEEWQQLNQPVQILRLPGIYGPGRSAIDNIMNGKYKLIDKPGQVFSRVHIDDIAGAIMHLIHLSNKGNRPKVINIADDFPTANIEVLTYAASLLNIKLPDAEQFETASKTMSPMALSFWEENRRVSNKLLCNKLGYSLLHPDYRSGLKECLLQIKNSK
tara:strand:+ start:3799 stop:4701 length:903 start_codon:yes stop_codon:yes gene_type:complete